MAVSISATEIDLYPVRMAVAVTGLTIGDAVTIYREVGAARTPVRGGATSSATDTAFSTVDAELPFGVPVRYIADVDGTEYATTAASHTLTGGKVVLSDAITGLAAEVQILAAETEAHTRAATRFNVAGRNVVVGQPMSARLSSYELFVETSTALADLETLLAAATEGIVQIRQPGGYDGIDAYLAVDGYQVSRWSQDGTDSRRTVVVTYAQVETWPAELASVGWTFGDVETYYSGQTFATVEGDYATFLDAQLGDYS